MGRRKNEVAVIDRFLNHLADETGEKWQASPDEMPTLEKQPVVRLRIHFSAADSNVPAESGDLDGFAFDGTMKKDIHGSVTSKAVILQIVGV